MRENQIHGAASRDGLVRRFSRQVRGFLGALSRSTPPLPPLPARSCKWNARFWRNRKFGISKVLRSPPPSPSPSPRECRNDTRDITSRPTHTHIHTAIHTHTHTHTQHTHTHTHTFTRSHTHARACYRDTRYPSVRSKWRRIPRSSRSCTRGDIADTVCINSAQPNVTQAREICKLPNSFAALSFTL